MLKVASEGAESELQVFILAVWVETSNFTADKCWKNAEEWCRRSFNITTSSFVLIFLNSLWVTLTHQLWNLTYRCLNVFINT